MITINVKTETCEATWNIPEDSTIDDVMECITQALQLETYANNTIMKGYQNAVDDIKESIESSHEFLKSE